MSLQLIYPISINIILMCSMWINWLNASMRNPSQISAFQKLHIFSLASAVWCSLGVFTLGLGPSAVINQLAANCREHKAARCLLHFSHLESKQRNPCAACQHVELWFIIYQYWFVFGSLQFSILNLYLCFVVCYAFHALPPLSTTHMCHFMSLRLLFGLHVADDSLHSAEGNFLLQIPDWRFLTWTKEFSR